MKEIKKIFYPDSVGSLGKDPEVNQKQEEAEIAIEDLRNKYAAKVREQFESSAKKLREERDNALRENWILQQQAEAAFPEQMAAAGINGGTSETTLANMKAKFQGDRNDIESGFMDNLGDLSAKNLENNAEMERNINERWLEYLLSLAKMEEESRYNGFKR